MSWDSASRLKAFRLLGCRSFTDARRRALRALAEARRCPCCKQLLLHLFDRLGSTLFIDDDPTILARAFDSPERDCFAPRVLAACVVLNGRQRALPSMCRP